MTFSQVAMTQCIGDKAHQCIGSVNMSSNKMPPFTIYDVKKSITVV